MGGFRFLPLTAQDLTLMAASQDQERRAPSTTYLLSHAHAQTCTFTCTCHAHVMHMHMHMDMHMDMDLHMANRSAPGGSRRKGSVGL